MSLPRLKIPDKLRYIGSPSGTPEQILEFWTKWISVPLTHSKSCQETCLAISTGSGYIVIHAITEPICDLSLLKPQFPTGMHPSMEEIDAYFKQIDNIERIKKEAPRYLKQYVLLVLPSNYLDACPELEPYLASSCDDIVSHLCSRFGRGLPKELILKNMYKFQHNGFVWVEYPDLFPDSDDSDSDY